MWREVGLSLDRADFSGCRIKIEIKLFILYLLQITGKKTIYEIKLLIEVINLSLLHIN